MKILIAVASRHGSTDKIAGAIAAQLSTLGHKVVVTEARKAEDINRFDAYTLGSAIYMGKWMKEAREFASNNSAALSTKPVWLFSSGPLGKPNPKPEGDPAGFGQSNAANQGSGPSCLPGKTREARPRYH